MSTAVSAKASVRQRRSSRSALLAKRTHMACALRCEILGGCKKLRLHRIPSVGLSSFCCGGYVSPLRISICCFRRQLAVNGSASNLARLFVTYRRYERVNDNDTDGLKEYAHICMGRFLFAFKCSGGFE